MRDVIDRLLAWWEAGEAVGMATVVATWESAPRQPGATMLVGPDGAVAGSVSGGCVEGAVYELAHEVVESGQPVVRRYGVSDDDAFAVGLTCGGTIEVLVERVDRDTYPDLDRVARDVRDGIPVAVATCVEPATMTGRRIIVWPAASSGTLGSDRADAAIVDDVRGMLASGSNGVRHYGPDGQRRGTGMSVFAAAFAPPPRMLVFGATDFAVALVRIGALLGYRVTVCDARAAFTAATRFPGAAEVVTAWPSTYLAAEAPRLDERTVICVVTHDPKFDIPLLEVALRLPVAYVGALGSRRTHDRRLSGLRAAGLGDAELARLASPAGLDLGGRTPEETAVSIAAEVIAGRWRGTGEPLRHTRGRIHHDPPAAP